MSTEQAAALVRRVQTDGEFRTRLTDAATEDRRAILTDEGYGDVKLTHVSQALPASHGGELSDEEFAAVTGGETTDERALELPAVAVIAASIA